RTHDPWQSPGWWWSRRPRSAARRPFRSLAAPSCRVRSLQLADHRDAVGETWARRKPRYPRRSLASTSTARRAERVQLPRDGRAMTRNAGDSAPDPLQEDGAAGDQRDREELAPAEGLPEEEEPDEQHQHGRGSPDHERGRHPKAARVREQG